MVTRSKLRSITEQLNSILCQQPPCTRGQLTQKNEKQIHAFYSCWLYLASDLVLAQDLDLRATEQRLWNFVSVLLHVEIEVLLTICMDAAHYLLTVGSCSSYEAFKGHLTRDNPALPVAIGRLLSPISYCVESFLTKADDESLKACLQFLRFGKKLNLESMDLEVGSLDAYLHVEDKLAMLDLAKSGDVIIALNKIMRKWLRRLDLRHIVPKHGSGSVAQGKLCLYDKHKALSVDVKLDIVLQGKTAEYYTQSRFLESIKTGKPYLCEGRALARVSRTVFVPKTFAKLRTISMEPATLMYWQQGVMRELYHYFDVHPYLRYAIQLGDQGLNQRVAKRASLRNDMATIDLSAASDSVSWDLVKGVFRRTPLLKWLYATRSSKTKLPTGKIIELKKFAPMGSALCFPVQCLLFAAVIEYVKQNAVSMQYSHPGYCVYGDDLIVNCELVSSVVDILSALGFEVNKTKSFVDGKFRESCGKDYYAGSDVSSLYYVFKINHSFDPRNKYTRLTPECYSALCTFANSAHAHGYKQLRSYIVKLLWRYTPYFTDKEGNSPAIYSKKPTNFHARGKRWHAEYQQWVAKFVTVLSTCPSRTEEDGDELAYFLRLAEYAVRKSSTDIYHSDVIDVALYGSTVRLGTVEREVVLT